jgi:hypothetical protein
VTSQATDGAPRQEVGEKSADPAERVSDSSDAAPATDRDEAAPSDEGAPVPEVVPPPPLQLGWVIVVLLGLTVLLIAWIVYRASASH